MTDHVSAAPKVPDLTVFHRRLRERREAELAAEREREQERDFWADLVPEPESTSDADESTGQILARIDSYRADPITDVYDQLVRGDRSKDRSGEVKAQCPMVDHEDVHPSASMNTSKGVWFCHACDVGGSVFDLAGAAWGYDVPVSGSELWDVKKRYAWTIHGLNVDEALATARDLLGDNIPPLGATPGHASPSTGSEHHVSSSADPTVDLKFERDVDERVHRLRVDAEARTRLRRLQDERDQAHLDLGYTFENLLTEPEETVRYTIDRLALRGGNTLLLGDSKTGKTEAVVDLLRALVDGNNFYGEFEPRPIEGNVCYLNFEVDKATIRQRMQALGIANVRRLRPLALRGKRFDLADRAVFDDLAVMPSQVVQSGDGCCLADC